MSQSLSNFYVVFYLVFHRLSWINFHLLFITTGKFKFYCWSLTFIDLVAPKGAVL